MALYATSNQKHQLSFTQQELMRIARAVEGFCERVKSGIFPSTKFSIESSNELIHRLISTQQNQSEISSFKVDNRLPAQGENPMATQNEQSKGTTAWKRDPAV